MQCPSELHFKAAKRVLRYVKGKIAFGVRYVKANKVSLIGFTDSDWAGTDPEMRSTSGYCFSIGTGVFSWSSRKQHGVSQSTAESEYVAANEAANQVVWLRKMLTDLKYDQVSPSTLLCDNSSAIAIARNPVFHGRTKHFNIKYHTIRFFQDEGEIDLKFCCSEEQLADIFIKPLPKSRFEELRERLGMISLVSRRSDEANVVSLVKANQAME